MYCSSGTGADMTETHHGKGMLMHAVQNHVESFNAFLEHGLETVLQELGTTEAGEITGVCVPEKRGPPFGWFALVFPSKPKNGVHRLREKLGGAWSGRNKRRLF